MPYPYFYVLAHRKKLKRLLNHSRAVIIFTPTADFYYSDYSRFFFNTFLAFRGGVSRALLAALDLGARFFSCGPLSLWGQ